MADLVELLRRSVAAAKAGDQVLTIFLFAIEHAAELRRLQRKDLAELAVRAGLSRQYASELQKAIRLAEHVRIISRPA
jgi:hypothetical protein